MIINGTINDDGIVGTPGNDIILQQFDIKSSTRIAI
jgi:hypothetical protein